MRKLELKGSEIRIGRGILRQAGNEILKRLGSPGKAFIVTDENVKSTAGRIEVSLTEVGFDALIHVLPPGEAVKTLQTTPTLYTDMLKHKMERGSVVVAVGGGVVGDLSGFVASTYMRGVPFVQIPTTLLAQVDASIGGKTGVDFGGYKNVVGTFYQPTLVLIDPATLSGLPEKDFRTGLAEVIKYGVIRDEELFEWLDNNLASIEQREIDSLEELVSKCAAIKVDVVNQDEKESGLRAILNFGHTIGHAIESAGDFSRYSHGDAVAIGMACETRIAVEQGLTGPATLTRVENLLRRYRLPLRAPGLDRETILTAIQADKKVRNGKPRFVLPERIGFVRHGLEVPEDVVVTCLNAILT